ncbi:MAG: hypothetical protein ACLQGP_15830 [Isosphaeraceae bacterium]
MFNRTNLTLSARTLSNRLNLGTRSLALNAGVNHGGLTLRTRLAFHGVMRDGMVWYDVFPITQTRYIIPIDPGSFSQQPQSQPSRLTEQLGRPVEVVRVEPDPRPADLVDRPERCAKVGVTRFPSVAVTVVERRSSERVSGSGSRSGWKTAGKPGLKRTAKRAAKAKAATAIAAASIGK